MSSLISRFNHDTKPRGCKGRVVDRLTLVVTSGPANFQSTAHFAPTSAHSPSLSSDTCGPTLCVRHPCALPHYTGRVKSRKKLGEWWPRIKGRRGASNISNACRKFLTRGRWKKPWKEYLLLRLELGNHSHPFKFVINTNQKITEFLCSTSILSKIKLATRGEIINLVIYIYILILSKSATRNVEHVEKLIRNRASQFIIRWKEFCYASHGGKKIASQHSDTVYFRHLHLSKFSSRGGCV